MTSTDEKISTVTVKVEYEDNIEHTNYPNSINQQSSENVIVKSEGTSDNCPQVSSSELASFCDHSMCPSTNYLESPEISCKGESGVFIKTEPIEFGEKGASETCNEVKPNLNGLTLDNKDVLRDELESKTGVINISEVIVMDSQANSVTNDNEESVTMISSVSPGIDQNTSNDLAGKLSAPNLSLQNFKFGVFNLKKFVKRKPVDGGGEVVTFQCNKCEFETQSDVFFKQHYKNNHSSEFHPCFTCCKLFLKKKSLQNHKWISHRASKTFSCSKCDFTADSYLLLRRHQRSKHLKQVYTCDQCEYQCKYESQLQRHQLKVHHKIKYGSNTFSCDVCCKRFYNLSKFASHKRVHTGERPYSCDLCDYASSQRGVMRIHKHRIHSQFKEQKSSSCEPACEQTLINRNDNRCVEHQCAMCSFKTPYWKILIGHRKRFHGNEPVNDIKEKRFQCGQCLKHFAYEGSLRRHTFGTKGRCLGIKEGISSIMKKDKIVDTSLIKSSKSKTKSGPSDSKVMVDLVELECQACNEQFPALKVLKRHLKYCVFNS